MDGKHRRPGSNVPINTAVNYTFFDVLLTVHVSIFILVINQLDAQNFVLQ